MTDNVVGEIAETQLEIAAAHRFDVVPHHLDRRHRSTAALRRAMVNESSTTTSTAVDDAPRTAVDTPQPLGNHPAQQDHSETLQAAQRECRR